MTRKWNLWGYIDARDGAQSVERALDAAIPGFQPYIIAAADTVMSRTNDELLADVFPDVPRRAGIDAHSTLLGIDKARRMLGYEPQFSWRDAV
jgi:UDP-glucose 4-epimerase